MFFVSMAMISCNLVHSDSANPKILIYVAFLFNRSFLCVEAVEDDALPIRRRNILSNSKQPGISRANILCTMFYLSFLIVDVAETVCTRFHF